MKEIFADELQVEDTRDIMYTTKNNLKEIRFDHSIYDNADAETIMNIIAEGTENLEILHIRCDIRSLSAFDKFIDKNKSTLRAVTILNHGKRRSESRVTKLMREFMECPLLQDICVDKVPAENTLKALRSRGIHFRPLLSEEIR